MARERWNLYIHFGGNRKESNVQRWSDYSKSNQNIGILKTVCWFRVPIKIFYGAERSDYLTKHISLIPSRMS